MESRLLTTAAIIASLAAAPVLAQPDQHNDHNGPGGRPGSGAPHETGGSHDAGHGHEMGGAPHAG